MITDFSPNAPHRFPHWAHEWHEQYGRAFPNYPQWTHEKIVMLSVDRWGDEYKKAHARLCDVAKRYGLDAEQYRTAFAALALVMTDTVELSVRAAIRATHESMGTVAPNEGMIVAILSLLEIAGGQLDIPHNVIERVTKTPHYFLIENKPQGMTLKAKGGGETPDEVATAWLDAVERGENTFVAPAPIPSADAPQDEPPADESTESIIARKLETAREHLAHVWGDLDRKELTPPEMRAQNFTPRNAPDNSVGQWYYHLAAVEFYLMRMQAVLAEREKGQ